MKKILLISLAAVFSVSSSVNAQFGVPAAPAAPAAPTVPARPVPAVPKAPAKPASPVSANDPFVRRPNSPKEPEPITESNSPVRPGTLLITVETWALSQADCAALLDGPANDRAPYDRLETMAKEGKAKLVGLIGVNGKSGHRVVVESIDEIRYPTQFDPAQRPGEIAFPKTFETRDVGDTIEVEAVLGPDGKTIDINLVPISTRFEGFRDWQAEAAAAPVGKPGFRTEKITTSCTIFSGQPLLFATATPDGAVEEKGATQVRVQILRATVQAAPPPPAPATEAVEARAEFLLYSLDRETARAILNDSADSAQSHAAVRALLAKGEAQLETVNVAVTKSGQRAVNEATGEFTYPSEFSGGGYATPTTPTENRRPASPTNFETRETGLHFELEPVVSPDGAFVDVNIAVQLIRMTGMLKADGVAAKYPPQPVFTTRKITTNVISGFGVPVLLGTMSQPRDNRVNDRQDDNRTSLAYLRVTAVHP
jgi:hypothetical protein